MPTTSLPVPVAASVAAVADFGQQNGCDERLPMRVAAACASGLTTVFEPGR